MQEIDQAQYSYATTIAKYAFIWVCWQQGYVLAKHADGSHKPADAFVYLPKLRARSRKGSARVATPQQQQAAHQQQRAALTLSESSPTGPCALMHWENHTQAATRQAEQTLSYQAANYPASYAQV